MLSKLGLYDVLKPNAHHKENGVICYHKLTEGKQLHGSFVIFSPDYIKNEEFAFEPGTFLYMEEAILFQYCVKKDIQQSTRQILRFIIRKIPLQMLCLMFQNRKGNLSFQT